MLWFAVWAVLLLLAGAVLARLGWSVVGKGLALVEEMGEAAQLLGEAAEQAGRLGHDVPPTEPAVFADPNELRRARGRRARRPARRGGTPARV